jgi:hypothetical protein
MNFSKSLHFLVEKDTKILDIPEFVIVGTYYDQNHTQRRMQQRAINVNMIRVALAYGKYQFYSHARTWTLLDKCLRNTMYEGMIDRLRGLRIIALIDKEEDFLFITTVYWDFKLAN